MFVSLFTFDSIFEKTVFVKNARNFLGGFLARKRGVFRDFTLCKRHFNGRFLFGASK